MIPIKPAIALMISTVVLLAPRLAAACAVCFTGRADETRIAFLVTTGMLTPLPILLVGSLVWWLYRRAQQIRTSTNLQSQSTRDARCLTQIDRFAHAGRIRWP